MPSALYPNTYVFRAFAQGATVPLSGGLLYFYAAGTSTPQAAYTDTTGSTPCANPLVLDANGVASFCLLSGLSYKINLTDANGVTQDGWPKDNILPDDGLAAFIALLAGPTGAAQIGYLAPYTGAVAGTQQIKNSTTISLYDFMTVAQIADAKAGTLTLDMTSSINSAIAALALFGGTIIVPPGRYKTTATIYQTSGVNLVGGGYQNPSGTATWEGTSSFYAIHTGAAVLSLKGAVGCKVEMISLEGDPTTHPKTGLCLGRSAAASSGFHHINRVGVFGYFSVAAIYSIASEVNVWNDIYVWLLGGTAKYTFYTGPKDLLAVDSLVQSTNLDNTLTKVTLQNYSSDANAACLYMEVGQSMGSWTFNGCYFLPTAGSYIQMNFGTIDGTAPPIGPFTFIGVSGERLNGGGSDPLYGVKLTASVGVTAAGLNIIGARFDLLSGATHYTIYQDPNLTLSAPAILIQPCEASPYAANGLIRSQIYGGVVSYAREAIWPSGVGSGLPNPIALPVLAGTWTNNYGAPYAKANYCIDSNGVVRLRGTVGGGTGAIFTLPVGFRPAVNMFFPVYATGGMGRVLITAATGVVSLSSGTATEVDLTSVQFNTI